MEKVLDNGNTTTESKIVREFYVNVKKDPCKEKKEDDDYDDGVGYEPVDDEVKSEEDMDNGSRYSRDSKFASRSTRDRDFHAWSSKINFKDTTDTWRRFPRSYENTSWNKPNEKIETVEKKVPVPVIKKKNLYSIYKRIPYEIKVPQPYTMEKRVPYPVKVNVNVPVEVPEPYQVEKQVPYKVKVDNPVPYKVEIPVLQSYTIEKRIPVEVPIPQLYTVKSVPYEIKIPVKIPTPYEVPVNVNHRPYSVPMRYPVKVKRSVPVSGKVPNPRPYIVKKHVPI